MRILILFFTCTLLFSCLQEKKIKNLLCCLVNGNVFITKLVKELTSFGKMIFLELVFPYKKNDTVFEEVLHIITKNDSLFLQVTGVNETSTLFAFTQQTDTSFTAENKLNEFPKTIQYWKENNLLKANVSNDEFSIDFVFEKIK